MTIPRANTLAPGVLGALAEAGATLRRLGGRDGTLQVTDDSGAKGTDAAITVDRDPTIDGPTAMGTCQIQTNGSVQTGIQMESFDATNSTEELTYNVTYEGQRFNGTERFAEPKGYAQFCVGVGAVEHGDMGNVTVAAKFTNGCSETFDTSVAGATGGFSLGGGGGGLFSVDPGSNTRP